MKPLYLIRFAWARESGADCLAVLGKHYSDTTVIEIFSLFIWYILHYAITIEMVHHVNTTTNVHAVQSVKLKLIISTLFFVIKVKAIYTWECRRSDPCNEHVTDPLHQTRVTVMILVILKPLNLPRCVWFAPLLHLRNLFCIRRQSICPTRH